MLFKEKDKSPAGMILPGVLSLALIAILYKLPQPAQHVNQPFKVELLLSLFLVIFFLAAKRRGAAAASFRNNLPISFITGLIASFILWSALSVVWGASYGSVTHHTLLWSVYLIFFLIFAARGWQDANLRFIVTTFVFVGLILGVLCIFDYATVVDFTSSEGPIRIRYGKYAELLVTTSPMLFAAAIYSKESRQRFFLALIGLLSWLTVMLSLSKGAFLAGIIGFVIFFAASAVFAARHFRRRVIIFASLWLAVTIGTQIFFSFFSAVPSTTNYITGAADQTRRTSAMRIFTWRVAAQMAADNWLSGVGADNFGLSFNKTREHYRKDNPTDPAEEIAEDYIVERAHNEPLQVLSELGIIGLILCAAPFVVFAFYFIGALIARRRFSPLFWAAAAGMAAFFVSSQFSSFSFRSAQNGVVFFMVFAVAVNTLPKKRPRHQTTTGHVLFSRPVYLLSFLIVLLLAAFCLQKVFAEYHLYNAERSRNYSLALDHFDSAIAVDPEYAGAYLSGAVRSSAEGYPTFAAQMTRKAIDYGLGVTPVYSQLAKRQIASGNVDDAEATFREALSIYPRSIFIRTEFIVFLEEQERSNEAAEQIAMARSVDLRHANGWYLLIKQGSVTAFYRSQSDQTFAPPADLTPFKGMVQYIEKIPDMEPVNPKSSDQKSL